MSKFIIITPDKDEKTITKTLSPFIPLDQCSFITTYGYNSKTKIPTKDHKQYIEEEIIPFVKENLGEYLLVFDANYFKLLANQSSAAKSLGYVVSTDLAHIVYVPNYKTALYNPKVSEDIAQALKAVQAHVEGSYKEPGKDIITNAIFPTIAGTRGTLGILHHYDKLTCDIETWSLKHYDSGIATIAFCWNEHEGTVLTIDVDRNTPCEENRAALREFFETYKGTIIFHNITYDVYILVYQLYMKDLQDTEGMLKGMGVLLKNFEDTKLIAYLATNSCAGNSLGLKTLAQEFAGNYAQEEIDDIDNIPKKELLEYNLIDGLSTWYVYNKYYPKMVEEDQEHIYKSLFKPAVRDIIQMQLTGLPLDMDKVLEAEKQMESIKESALKRIHSSPLVQEYMEIHKERWAKKKNATLKKKRVTSDDCPDDFNPSSSLMLKGLLYDLLELPILDLTPSKEPATGKDVLAKLLSHTDSQDIKDLLQALIEFKEVIKILTAFIPAFKSGVLAPDGRHYLFGSQNSTGTVSGRYSASRPNLAQLPSTGTKFAKLIKGCFAPPEGTLFVGIDFASLEDRISALVTKDSNKLKVYTDHYDGHCLRAYYYYKDQMTDISKEIAEHPENQVEIINSIKDRYKALRQASKAPTFALTYGGSHLTLQKNCGFSEEEAKRIEESYHELYTESDEWTKTLLSNASKQGFVLGAFGLKVRTPALKRSLLGLRVTPKEVEAEGRTAANAAIQSYGMLTARAINAFMTKVHKSKYRTKIRVCNIIHDAAYFLIDDDINTFLWLNENIVKEFQWQDDPAIAHPEVHLGGDVSIFQPDWAHEIVIPNGCTKEQLLSIANDNKEN